MLNAFHLWYSHLSFTYTQVSTGLTGLFACLQNEGSGLPELVGGAFSEERDDDRQASTMHQLELVLTYRQEVMRSSSFILGIWADNIHSEKFQGSHNLP